MHTTITIRHESVEALKASALWAQIMELFLVDGPVSVVEVAAVDETEEV